MRICVDVDVSVQHEHFYTKLSNPFLSVSISGLEVEQCEHTIRKISLNPPVAFRSLISM